MGVTVVPGGNKWSLMGQGLGQGFNQGVSQSAPMFLERSLIQQGLNKLSNLTPEQMKEMQSDPIKAISQILAPFAGTRQGAQYAEAIMPNFMQMLESQAKGSPEAGEGISAIQDLLGQRVQRNALPGYLDKPGMEVKPSQVSEKYPELTNEDAKNVVIKGMGEKYFPNVEPIQDVDQPESFRPQYPLKPLPVIGAGEKQKMRGILHNKGIRDPKAQDAIINDILTERKERYDAAKEGFANIQSYQESRQKEDQRFYNIAEPVTQDRFGKLTAEEDNIWKGISRLAENSGPDESRMRNTNQMFDQLVYEPITSFSRAGPVLPSGSIFRPDQVQNNLNDAKSIVQDHLQAVENRSDLPKELKGEIKNYLRDKYATELAGKDWGIAQSAYAVSNLNPKFEKSLKKAPEPKYESKYHGAPAQKVQFKSTEERQKYINDLAKSINGLSEEDSLVLAREQAIQNNYDENMFNEALNMAIHNGFRLSDFQRMERPKLSVGHRLTLDDVMQGRRSFLDIFKGKK